MAKKESSPKASSIAARILRSGDKRPMTGDWAYTHADVKILAASVLSQDETKGQKKRPKKKVKKAKKSL